MTNTTKKTQKTIETFLQAPLTGILTGNSSDGQIFSKLKEWIFEMGPFVFLLNPINRRWLFWDKFHSDWEDTGYYAGEVEFVWNGEKLLTKELSEPKTLSRFNPIAELVTSNGLSQKYPVLANTLIGNERNCDIKIDESDINALILQHEGGFTFFALGKKDTTFVNNNIVPQEGILLDDGDKIVLGKTKLIFKKISQPKQGTLVKRFCPYCGAKIKEGQKFCTSCGKKLQ